MKNKDDGMNATIAVMGQQSSHRSLPSDTLKRRRSVNRCVRDTWEIERRIHTKEGGGGKKKLYSQGRHVNISRVISNSYSQCASQFKKMFDSFVSNDSNYEILPQIFDF